MRTTVIGAALGVTLVAIVWQVLPAQGLVDDRASRYPSNGGQDLITWTSPAGDDYQLLTVIDPDSKVVGVYHLELKTGEITLRSVRNITWDLQMLEFNGTAPTPREIRSQLEQ
jgi:hypothetical protein